MAQVNILPQYCKGCGYCVAQCPKKVLEIGNNINPQGYRYAQQSATGCIACKMCAVACPESAIEVFK